MYFRKIIIDCLNWLRCVTLLFWANFSQQWRLVKMNNYRDGNNINIFLIWFDFVLFDWLIFVCLFSHAMREYQPWRLTFDGESRLPPQRFIDAPLVILNKCSYWIIHHYFDLTLTKIGTLLNYETVPVPILFRNSKFNFTLFGWLQKIVLKFWHYIK